MIWRLDLWKFIKHLIWHGSASGGGGIVPSFRLLGRTRSIDPVTKKRVIRPGNPETNCVERKLFRPSDSATTRFLFCPRNIARSRRPMSGADWPCGTAICRVPVACPGNTASSHDICPRKSSASVKSFRSLRTDR